MKLRDYQTQEAQAALQWLRFAPPGARRMASAPTGTGKGTIQIAILSLLNKAAHSTVLLTPSVEIIKGLISRFPGFNNPESVKIYTPKRYLNLLERGEAPRAQTIIIDECHEWIPSNQFPQHLARALPRATWLGYTATPYRGTRIQTHELLEFWGKPITVIGLSVAIARGFFSLPNVMCVPLIDDDHILKRANDFVSSSVNEYLAQQGRLRSLAELIDDAYDAGCRIVVSVASRMMGNELQLETRAPCFYVSQGTCQEDRDRVYAANRGDQRLVILQLGVLYRGVDLPWLDTLIDAQPTLSSSRWMQTVGRITRPWKGMQKSLVITNRNFERHGYLMAGALPPDKLYEMESAWGEADNRYTDSHRWLGFERSRKCFRLQREDGRVLLWYRLGEPMKNSRLKETGVLLSPQKRVAVWGERTKISGRRGWTYGVWKRCKPLMSAVGLRSGRDTPPSVAQVRVWERNAARYGLAGLPLTSEHVTAMSFMRDLRLKA